MYKDNIIVTHAKSMRLSQDGLYEDAFVLVS